MKLSSVIDGYWLDKQLEFSPKTVVNYTRYFNHLIEFVDDIEFEQVTSNHIRAFLLHLATEHKVSRRTVHDAWIPLSSLWTWAEKELGTPHIIRGKIKMPSFTKKKVDPFTKDEIKQLVEMAEYTAYWTTPNGKRTRSKRPTGLRDKAIILTLLDSGIRSSETCDLIVSDYDAKRGRLHIRHGKGDKERFTMVGNRTRKALWRYLATREALRPTEPLFATKTGSHLERNNLRHTLQIIAKQADVKKVHPHRFRHTFAINFLRNGGNVILLKELLGHSELDMVMEYLKLTEIDLEAGQKHSPVDNWRSQ